MSSQRRRPKKSFTKRDTVAENLAKTLLQYVSGRRFSPASFPELTQQLAIAEVHIPLFQEVVDSLVSKGTLVLHNGKYTLPRTAPLVTGTISVHAKGFGFVKNLEGPDIFIPKQAIKDAVDGDLVEVEVGASHSPKGPEGAV